MLEFDASTHVYRWNGSPVPSVTQILAPLGSDFRFVKPDVLDRSRDLGQAVHQMIELDAAGVLDESSVTGVLACYLEQWRRFVAATGFRVSYSELRLYSARYGYAGTLDLLGVLDRHETLIDTKTGAVPRVAKPQTAAYANLLVENGMALKSLRRRALDLKPDSWHLSDEYRDPRDLNVFLAALTLHNWRAAA